jgi:hypothetical protein
VVRNRTPGGVRDGGGDPAAYSILKALNILVNFGIIMEG